MQFALWAYPWDVLDEGVESVADRCAELGVSELNLATNYHSVQPFLPHNPERKTFFAHASAYFQPESERYGRLSPVPNETMGEADWLGRITDAIGETHLSVNSWTVGCHNSRLGMANPDLTLESPFGDSLAFGLCPSQPAVQEYLTGLLSDLSARADFDRIELETFDYFYGTGFGWHHDKYHLELGRLGEFLFGLCFCDTCRENAEAADVDVEAAREAARDGVRAAIGAEGESATTAEEWVRARPQLSAYVDHRCTTLTDLYADLRASVDGDAELGRYVGFFDVADAWMHGADLEALASPLDYYTVVAYESSRDAVVERIETAEGFAGDVPLHAGVLPGHPAITDGEVVADVVDGLAETGVERVSFYNYGLLPDRNLGWVREATKPYR
jgi:hypothetical protein